MKAARRNEKIGDLLFFFVGFALSLAWFSILIDGMINFGMSFLNWWLKNQLNVLIQLTFVGLGVLGLCIKRHYARKVKSLEENLQQSQKN